MPPPAPVTIAVLLVKGTSRLLVGATGRSLVGTRDRESGDLPVAPTAADYPRSNIRTRS
jgi:hypothetical protein